MVKMLTNGEMKSQQNNRCGENADRQQDEKSAKALYGKNADRWRDEKSAKALYGENADRWRDEKSAK